MRETITLSSALSSWALPARMSAVALAVALSACGGGEEPVPGPVATPPPVLPVAVVFSGVAATGAPMVGATVRVVDSRGQEVGRSAAVGQDGRYSVTLSEGAQSPFVVVASLSAGTSQVAAVATTSSSTVNVTPLTSLMAARLSSNGQPEGLVRDFTASGAARQVPSAEAIQTATNDVIRVIAPLAGAVGDSTHPVTGNFAVGGTGHDKLLDSLTVTITPKSDTATNIELTVRTKRPDDQAPPAVAFSSTTRDMPVVPAVDRNALASDRASAKIDELVAKLNACYALPLADRVDSAQTPATIKAGPCRDMFFNADPSGYLHSSGRAVPGGGAFAGVYSGIQLVFDRPVFEYERAGSDEVVFSLRWKDTAGNSDTVMLVSRPQGDTLRLIGNQQAHPMEVRPLIYRAEFLRSDVTGHDFTTTGYTLQVTNRQANGQAVYHKVVVQAPVGLERGATRDEFVLWPMPGHSSLRMKGNWTPTQTSQVVRLAGAFNAPRTSEPLHPRQITSSGAVWVNGEPWSDDRLERISHKSVWTFKYFLAGNTGDTPDAVQHLTTLSRAPSLREAAAIRTAELTEASRAFLQSYSAEPNARMFWFGARPGATGEPTSTTPVVELGWTVPEGAIAPLSLWMWGRTTSSYSIPWESRTSFDAGRSFTSSTRSSNVTCPVNAISATLCDASEPARFSRMTLVTDFELSGRDERLVQVVKTYKTYVPSVRVVN
ncbi:MAG: hypothetical protein JNJ71_09755 [Rubrivivax sp.]|nr:hypothetical protein [Rubrivivax sp.]